MQYNTINHTTRQDNTRPHTIIQDKSITYKTRQDNIRQYPTIQGKAKAIQHKAI